jgi:cysteine desulfurase
MDKLIYVDNAATTALDKDIFEKMIPYLTEIYGNPSSIHKKGREAKEAVEKSRIKVATAIGCEPKEIYFTGGGSEADNWAILGVAKAKAKKGKHIISTEIEHHAVLHTLKALEKEGYEVTYLKVKENGVIDINDFKNAIRPDTILVTIMFANNEIGTIMPIEEIGQITREKGILFHTDAVQAVGNVEIDVAKLNIDLLSMAAHKFYGPKGIGALYIKKSILIPNLIYGGGQERNKRAGTENVAGIVGMSYAVEKAVSHLNENAQYVKGLRDKLIDGVLKSIPYSRLNGDKDQRLPGNANFSLEYIEGESILLMLDLKGICASSGSACTSGSLDPSHVLLSLGLSHEVAHGSLRITLGHHNTEEEIDYILEVLPEVVAKLRQMSPLWEKVEKK